MGRQNERRMEKKYFPIFIDLSEKKIVVIGGGAIATRRVNTLLQFAKQILVAAPEITAELQELNHQGRIEWVCGAYHSEQITDADMVIAATNQPAVNHQVKKDCEREERVTGRRIMVSVIDDKELCDFYFPSIVQSEEIVIGINSGGKSPTVTKHVRKQIEDALGSHSIYKPEMK